MSCERCGSQTPNTGLCRECQLLERAEEETARSHAPPLYECEECGDERAESPGSTCWLCRSDRHERGDDGSPEPVSESDEIATDGGEDLKEKSNRPQAETVYPDDGRKVWVEVYPGEDLMIELGGIDCDKELYLMGDEGAALREALEELEVGE